MTGLVPTRLGDVLTLTTAKVGSMHIVCPVATDGQQECTADHYVVFGRLQAEAKARELVAPKGCVFVLDQDSGDWERL